MQTPAVTVQSSFPPPVVVAGGQMLDEPASAERRMEFEDLLWHNLPRFRRVAMRWLRNHEDAEDAVQDAMLSAFKHIARFEGRSQMSSWLMAIVINAVRMQLRRRPRCKIVSLDEAQPNDQYAISELIADPGPTPEQTVEKSELCEIVARIAEKLPQSQRAALDLRQREGLSLKDTAEALGVPEGTLKSQLARGRSKLTQRVRKAIGASGRGTVRPASKPSREASSDSRCRRDPARDVPPLTIAGLKGQAVCESWMGA
jgi:RNA polymerase sigma-70 factor (ECF subfamily)